MPTKEDDAKGLARKHYEIEPGMTGIFRVTAPGDLESREDEPIKLLEVNENTVPSGIMPIWFGPSPAAGLHHASIILGVTPDEFEGIRKEQLGLPNGWKLSDLIPKPDTIEFG